MKTDFTLLRWGMLILVGILFTFPLLANDENCNDIDLFSIHCPDDITVSCTDEIWDLSIYGNAQYHDYTGWHDAGYPVENWNLNSCDVGTVTRTWTVEDYNWVLHSCTQTITVTGGSDPFGYSDINWPNEHVNLEGCYPNTHPSQLPYEDGYPTYNYAECSNIGISYSDQIFNISGTCKKIMRKWQVMDWCQYNPNAYPYGSSNGLWTFYQFIKISQGDVPDVFCPGDIEVSSYNCHDAVLETDPLEVDATACGGYYTITNNSPYAYSNGADISGVYPIGYTNVKYTVEYGCGKKKYCTTKVHVVDHKAPTVYCLAEITTALMGIDEDGDGIPEDGMVEIWAKDLDKGSSASCNHYGSLKYSFSEDPDDGFRVFTCDDVGSNEVRMYVTDSQGRQAYCLVNVVVQNNGANIPDCEPTDDSDDDDDTYGSRFSLAGSVSQGDLGYANATIQLTDMTPQISFVTTLDTTLIETVDSFQNWSGVWLWYTVIDSVFSQTTDTITTYNTIETQANVEGYWLFAEVADSTDSYEIQPTTSKDIKHTGVDKDDLDFLLDVLLGNSKFERLEQYIAADINSDRKVNFDDLKLILNHISGEEQEVLLYDWVILDAKYGEVEAETAFKNYTTKMTMDINGADHMDMNMMAIKLGDIVQEGEDGLSQMPTVTDMVRIFNQESLTESTLELDLREAITGAKDQDVKVSPNPFLDDLNINYTDNNAGSVTIELIEAASGRSIHRVQQSTTPGLNEIRVSMADYRTTGIIIYRIVDGQNVFSGKVIRL